MKQFSLCLALLVCAVALRAENPAPAAPAPKVTVSVDTTDAPDLKDWAEKAKGAIEKFYPTLAAKLGLDDAREIALVVKKDVKGAGSVDGAKVVLGAEHFKNKPDDFGTAVFLIVRSLQNYKAADNANWVITGIADYIRWHAYEPEKRELINPKTARFSNGFGDAAAFLAWIEKAHDKDVIRKLHAALRAEPIRIRRCARSPEKARASCGRILSRRCARIMTPKRRRRSTRRFRNPSRRKKASPLPAWAKLRSPIRKKGRRSATRWTEVFRLRSPSRTACRCAWRRA